MEGFSPAAAARLHGFIWPGNVRQLQNEVQRAVLMSEGRFVEECDLSLPAPIATVATTCRGLGLMEAMERNTILQVLKETRGNKVEAAQRLGIGRQTLYNKLKSYGIEGKNLSRDPKENSCHSNGAVQTDT